MSRCEEPSEGWKVWVRDQLTHIKKSVPFPLLISRNLTTDRGALFTLPESPYATHLEVAFYPTPGVYARLRLMDQLMEGWVPVFSAELGYEDGVRSVATVDAFSAELARVHSLCYGL